jgi:hypothetical protein
MHTAKRARFQELPVRSPFIVSGKSSAMEAEGNEELRKRIAALETENSTLRIEVAVHIEVLLTL